MLPRLWLLRMPWMLLAATLGLMTLGWLAIGRAENLSGRSTHYALQQLVWCGAGLTMLVVAARANAGALCRASYGIFAGVLVALVAVYFFAPVNGAQRWIRLGRVGIQPSEFAKLAFVLMLARYLMYRDSFRTALGLLVPIGLTIVPMLLILKEPDLGTSIVFLPVLLAMVLFAGARKIDLLKFALLGLLIAPLLWVEMSREQRSRITALAEQNTPDQTPTADGYHLHQAKQMFALGGVWGTALAREASEELGVPVVPEPHTDSIFCIVGERYGLWGAGLLLTGCFLLVASCLRVAQRSQEPFGRLVAVGVAALFATEVTINTAMMVGLLPITGLSLPLVSYGGSGMLAHCLALGLVVNVALKPGFEVAQEPFVYRQSALARGRHAA